MWASDPDKWNTHPLGEIPSPQLQRAQYGSDFLLIITVSASIAGLLWTLSKVVRNLAEAARINQSMGALHDAELRERKANAAKTEAETDLLRLQIEEAKRRLASPEMVALTTTETAKAFVESGSFGAQDVVLDRGSKYGKDAQLRHARSLMGALRTLAAYDMDLRVEEE